MARKSRIKKRLSSKVWLDKRQALVLIGIITLLVIISSAGFKISSLTGASISVKYYGISDEPLAAQIGKIQTLIEFNQPLLLKLREESGRVEATEVIRQSTDYSKNVVNLYTSNPLASSEVDDLEKIKEGAAKSINFDTDSTCLKRIGSNFGRLGSYTTVLASDLSYQSCTKKDKWSYVVLRHTFLNEYGEFVCTQDSEKLFLVDRRTGDVSLDTEDC
ncbi:MAG: hypothetical protein Q8Q01_01885 [archaeon]|nr:hypothetical protein [archaeon]